MDLKDAQTQKGLLGVILVAGLSYAFYQYVYTPKTEAVAEKQAQAERLEAYNRNAKTAAQSNRIAALEQEGISYARRLEAFEELIPTVEQVPVLLERIATAALEADVDLLSFAPLPAQPGTFYTEQFYEVEIRGGYHDVGNFLSRIANLPRIIKPTITELVGELMEQQANQRGPAAEAAAAPPRTVVHAKLQLSTYVLPGGEAPVVGSAGAAGAPTPVPTQPAGAPEAAPLAAPPVAPGGGLAPGVAPGVAGANGATSSAAQEPSPNDTQSGAAQVAPPPADATADAARAGGAPGAPPAGGVGQATAAAGLQASAPAPAAPAANPAPAPPGPPPSPVSDLPPTGGRSAAEEPSTRPGAAPPLGQPR